MPFLEFLWHKKGGVAVFYILIEENYSENNRVHQLLDGIGQIAKKKHDETAIFKHTDELPDECRVAIIICQSLKWSTDRIEELNARGIHPLVFGFQYLDTMYKYSSIAPNYTKSAYRLTKYILTGSTGKTAILGYNEDSLPDRLKYIGIRYAVNEAGGEYVVFKNHGNVLQCLDEFEKRCGDIENIVCCNDNIAVMLHAKYKSVAEGRKICFCSGNKISEFFEKPYPVCRIDYTEAGIQLALLYRFLLKEEVIYSTVMTFDLEFLEGRGDIPMSLPAGAEIYSSSEVDFYGDENLSDMEALDNMLSNCDETDIAILSDITAGMTYEKIADKHYLAINTVKYRVKKMLDTVGTDSRRALIALLESYGVKFKNCDKTE